MSLMDGYVVNQEITSILKVYPDFIRLYKYNTPYYIKRFDYDPYNPNKKEKKKRFVEDDDVEKRSLRRAKTVLTDTALCNYFDMFFTFTFANDRQNVDAKKRQMAFWLNNQRIKYGAFRYLIVPEYHKDGVSIHFHGLFGGYKGRLKDSGKYENGRKVYNIKSFQAGFTTAVKIDNIHKVSSYITKYITKDMPKFKNKQRYWCSNGLKRPLKILNPLLDKYDTMLFKSVHKDNKQEIFELQGSIPDYDLARIADYGRRRTDDLMAAEW